MPRAKRGVGSAHEDPRGSGRILAALSLAPTPVMAANTGVNANGASQFVPRDVTVNAGDSVTWTNLGGFHNVHLDDNSFVQPPHAEFPPWTVSHTFITAGTYR